jgi:single-stranded-DNA-specific exonuclease RecJ
MLRSRGIRTEEEARRFLSPSPEDLHDPFLLPGMRETVALLRAAIARGDTILVYGDYDADGVCAASILLDVLHEEGASLAYRIPSRHSEGYGLNAAAVREIAEKARLLITVDCGISNVDEVALARELGLTVIITDHHRPPEILPDADAVMDPLLGDYPCPYLCGAGVALKICQALQGIPGAEKRLDLAALATVADIVPLLDENRFIVSEGLRRLENTPRPGLRALMASAGLTPPLTADHIAFRLAPRLNAAGRLGDARLGVHLLLTPDPAKAENIAGLLEQANRTRQNLEKEMTGAALTHLTAESLAVSHVIVVSGEGWNPGLVGLTAGRLCERFHLPVLAFSLRDGIATGSCRSIPGVDIYRALCSCADLLIRFGGHEQAAGLTVREENLPLLKARLEEVIASSAPEETFLPAREYDLTVPFRTWTPDALAWLERLEPTGCGNPPPQFLLQGAEVQSLRRVGRDGSHLRLTVLDEDLSSVEGIAFSLGEAADEAPLKLDLLYRPVRSEFRGRVTVEAQVTALNIV